MMWMWQSGRGASGERVLAVFVQRQDENRHGRDVGVLELTLSNGVPGLGTAT